MPVDYETSRPAQIRAQHAWALPRSLLGQRLRESEKSALRTALVEMLDRGKKTASILFALGRAGGQDAMPRITAELRQQIGRDAWAVHQAVYTLDNLLYVPEGAAAPHSAAVSDVPRRVPCDWRGSDLNIVLSASDRAGLRA
jgi:hypothetical protein